MDQVSDEQIKMMLKLRESESWPIHIERVLVELQWRRATDRKVIEAKKDYMRAESHKDSVELAVMLKAISELES